MIFKCHCQGRVEIGRYDTRPERNTIKYIPFNVTLEIKADTYEEAKGRAQDIIRLGKVECMNVVLLEKTVSQGIERIAELKRKLEEDYL
jgi:hypothetical protein